MTDVMALIERIEDSLREDEYVPAGLLRDLRDALAEQQQEIERLKTGPSGGPWYASELYQAMKERAETAEQEVERLRARLADSTSAAVAATIAALAPPEESV